MKKWIFTPFVLLGLLSISAFTHVNNKSKADSIEWLSFEEAVKENDSDKKLIFIDVYTDWCGWCKVMDKKTFTDETVKSFMNDNFHNVKLDAEQKEQIQFAGKTFEWVDAGRNGIHQLAYSLLKGQLSYPSFVVLDAEFKRVKILKGYQQPQQLLQQLKPLVEKHKNKS
ncbi:thioredoxin family protein [Membranihabitans maritimus]|uniref:thioredoxin family protein n=1 Tax=Membranihabitans maritimus TaxID=2904244 RepID=UPI001F26FCAA|nr:DUF255 domain-containing protein [Membranihabitans maritimus]